MPLDYLIDEKLGLAIVVAHGRICDGDLQDVSRKMLEDPARTACLRELDDWRAVTVNELTSAALRRMASKWEERDRTGLPTQQLAMVSARDEEYGLARMYEAFRIEAPVDIRAFRNMAEAELWLGIPEGSVDRRVADLGISSTAGTG